MNTQNSVAPSPAGMTEDYYEAIRIDRLVLMNGRSRMKIKAA